MKTDRRIIIIPDFMVVFKAINEQPDQSLNEIHFKTTITYSHLHHINKTFQNKGWVTVEREGRRFKINLTEKGKEILDAILMVFDRLGITDETLKDYRQRTKHKKKDVEDVAGENIVEDVKNGGEDKTTL